MRDPFLFLCAGNLPTLASRTPKVINVGIREAKIGGKSSLTFVIADACTTVPCCRVLHTLYLPPVDAGGQQLLHRPRPERSHGCTPSPLPAHRGTLPSPHPSTPPETVPAPGPPGCQIPPFPQTAVTRHPTA